MLSRTALVSFVVLAFTMGCGPTMPSHVGPPLPRTAPAEPFVHSIGMAFVLLPPGWVESASSDIQLRRPLLVSAYEITNAQYEQFDPDHARHPASPGDAHPVNNVTPEQANAFCRWLTEHDDIGRRFRLPDEAEWEYAARGDIDYTQYPWGDEIDRDKACYDDTGARPVGSYSPNEFGLYDVAGNVAEWVATDDIPDYVLRGGAWNDEAAAVRLSAVEVPPLDDEGKVHVESEELDRHGFRVICEPPLLR